MRRATLFEQLVSLERRRTGKLRDDPGLNARRNELMSQLEALDDALTELAISTATTATASSARRQRCQPSASSGGRPSKPRSESLNAGSAAR